MCYYCCCLYYILDEGDQKCLYLNPEGTLALKQNAYRAKLNIHSNPNIGQMTHACIEAPNLPKKKVLHIIIIVIFVVIVNTLETEP